MEDFRFDEEPVAPPHDVRVEMATIGSMMYESGIVACQAVGLKPEHFYRPAHQVLCKAIYELHEAFTPVDLLTLTDQLGGNLDDLGGADYVAQCLESVFSALNAAHYARIVVEHWTRRAFMRLGTKAGDEEVPIAELQVAAENIRTGFEASRAPTLKAKQVGSLVTGRRKEGIPSGLPSIDKHLLCKGYPIGQTTIIGGDSKAGKTTLMIQSALHQARLGIPVIYCLFADLEGEDVAAKVMKMMTGYSYEPDQLDAHSDWRYAREELEGLPFFIYDPVADGMPRDIETWLLWAPKAIHEHGARVVYLDYAQKIRSRDRKAINRYEESTCVSDKTQIFAREQQIALVIGSQLTSSKDQGVMAKGNRVWDEDGGLILHLTRCEDDPKAREIRIARSRFQGMGEVERFKADEFRQLLVGMEF